MTKRSSVDRFLSHESLALAGASRGGKKFGNYVLRDLTKKGWRVSLVHPEAEEIDGHPCHPSVSALPEEVGGLVLVVPPAQTGKLVREAADRGIRSVWMQKGAESPEALAFCAENGIDAIHGECILMFARPTGIHRFHRFLRGLFGRLPEADA